MEKKNIFEKTSIPSLGSSAGSQLHDELPPSPLVLIVDSYSDNLVVKYLVAPIAKHPFLTTFALLAFLFGSLPVCGHWNAGEVCDRRFNYLAFFIAVGLLGLKGYATYLGRKLEKGRMVAKGST
ncbi:hypothetical protein N7536_011032 [Penicillium majusculum]|uniref:Uncharacterized protein n=1 Tax=Penicillium solitum TaxID=60172 RepID=A0A1V6R4C0_9EURO|nr:uncharacterized protein PENSOL_c016G11855 [Penicillium solitum]KAJ5688413.1 hypothetical protein N7536_011032 [Penicillium majusculum]OQD96368.1 hypothetical protein PENSOL_c016G11855 [Penicillium solitum]